MCASGGPGPVKYTVGNQSKQISGVVCIDEQVKSRV